MGRRPPSFEYSGDTQDERTRANRGHIFCSTRPSADELNGFAIAHSLDDPVATARDADQIDGRTIRKGVRWHEPEAAIAGHGRLRFRDDMDRGLGKACKHL